ncbi:SusE domain-containing protein [Winogradskyella vidalii]|uniref:SusE domain-containing protein n=1 Tax=Winogradskyella vidalii TaxID=2615024 RepID=UPI0015C6A001|nr:SusE domain-containing protein [Winogradskyella vidalii]
MKKLSILGLFIFALISFNSCETEDDIVFTTQAPEGFVFTNSILDSYVLTSSTSSNLGERFTWTSADFGVPTNGSYELQSSILGDFTDAAIVNTATDNEIAMTIGQMMSVATEAGLDNDPDSPEPSTGSFSVRVRALAGDAGGADDVFSNVLIINVELLEGSGSGNSGIEPATWGVVGDGYNAWGDGGPDGQFYTTSEAGVLVAYVTLIDGEIKFRENNAWDSDLGAGEAEGSLEVGGANIPVTAGTYKITMNTNENTYTMVDYSWGVVGDGYNNWGETPDAKFYYDYTTDTFKVDVKLLDGEVKFRLNNSWDVEFGGDNIPVTAGHYSISINLNDNSYTLEESDVWGIVGDGYNAWGETPDFSLTQIQPDVYVGDIATFVDGEIKFRLNSAWDTDYGDNGADGTLDAGGENIAVTAGLYRVQMDVANGTYMLNKIQ